MTHRPFAPFSGVAPELVDYEPLHDPAFLNDVLDVVVQAQGDWRHPGRVVLERRGGTCDCAQLARCVGEAVSRGRRVGLVIEGDKRFGYRLVGFRHVPYVRPDAELAWPPAEFAVQLTIAEVG